MHAKTAPTSWSVSRCARDFSISPKSSISHPSHTSDKQERIARLVVDGLRLEPRRDQDGDTGPNNANAREGEGRTSPPTQMRGLGDRRSVIGDAAGRFNRRPAPPFPSPSSLPPPPLRKGEKYPE
ncbi:hypothetical protein ACHAWF_012714 [Thalassiosira exigua]